MQQQAKKRSHPPTLPDLPVHYRVDITREISIHDPFANIVRVTLVYGQDTHHDIGFLGEPQIDHLVVNFPDNPPTHIPLTRAPTIQITGPINGSQHAFPYQVQLRGSVTTFAGIRVFGRHRSGR